MIKYEIQLVPTQLRRIIAFGLDELNRFLFMAPFFTFVGLASFFERPTSYTVSVLGLSWLLYYGYRVFCLYFVGATFGKYVCGLRIVNRHSSENEELVPVDLGPSLVRILADDLGVFFFYLPRALVFFRLDRTQFSDWCASTKVVSVRGGVAPIQRSSLLGATMILFMFLFSFEF